MPSKINPTTLVGLRDRYLRNSVRVRPPTATKSRTRVSEEKQTQQSIFKGLQPVGWVKSRFLTTVLGSNVTRDFFKEVVFVFQTTWAIILLVLKVPGTAAMLQPHESHIKRPKHHIL